MSRSPRYNAAQPVDSVLAAAMQRLTDTLSTTTDVEGRLTAAVYAASLPPAPHVKTPLDMVLSQGHRELLETLEATTDVESRLILTLSEIDLSEEQHHDQQADDPTLPHIPDTWPDARTA